MKALKLRAPSGRKAVYECDPAADFTPLEAELVRQIRLYGVTRNQSQKTCTFSAGDWGEIGLWLGKYQGGLEWWHRILEQIEPQGASDL